MMSVWDTTDPFVVVVVRLMSLEAQIDVKQNESENTMISPPASK